MSSFKFETSFQFPITKVTSLIQHFAVSKPTGISYILLVLISESVVKSINLSKLLIYFGVPLDLHGIFADEIQKLIHDLDIIKCNFSEYNKMHFSEYNVGDFSFTEKGKKVFKEELIPTNKAVESKQELFFDPVHNVLMTKIPIDVKINKVCDSILNSLSLEKFAYEDLIFLEEYLNSVKGKGIVVKAEEIITEVSIINNEYFQTTYPVILTIDSENEMIEFDFNDRQTQGFFEKNYDNILISKGLAFKRKFKFMNNIINVVDSNIINKAQVRLPEEYEEILNTPIPIIISKGNYYPKQTTHVINSNFTVSKINPNIETIHIYSSDNISAYIPAKVLLKNKSNNGKTEINLLVEQALDSNQKQVLVEGLYEQLKPYSIYNTKESFYIFTKLNEISTLKRIINQYFKANIEENIIILKEIKETNDVSIISDWFIEKSQSMYDEYFKKIEIKSLASQFAIGGWLFKYLNIPDILVIRNIIDSNPKLPLMDMFIQLESLRYSLIDIFSQMDILGEFVKVVLSNNTIIITGEFSKLIKTIQVSINQLRNLTGISSPYKFIIKDDINREKYLELYNGFILKLRELQKYEKFSPHSFEEIKEYDKHFKYLSIVFTEEKNASANPKNIDEKFVLGKINKNDYFSAVIYLFAKLEWVLKTNYKMNGNMETMISELSKNEDLKAHVSSLHQFRKVRNNYIHPDEKIIKAEKSDLQKWANIVFKEVLKG